MTKLENGRDDPDFYIPFINLGMKHIVGVKKWNLMAQKVTSLMLEIEGMDGNVDDISHKLVEQKCWTHSDEALLLTIVANNLDNWVSRHKKEPRGTSTQRFTKIKKQLENNVKKVSVSKEWSLDGIAYYNARIKTIQEHFDLKKGIDIAVIKGSRLKKKIPKETPATEPTIVPTIFESVLDSL